MVVKFGAVYEGGLFRPTEPVNLPEGATVELTVSPIDQTSLASSSTDDFYNSPGQIAFRELRKIAELPDEVDEAGEAISERVDELLYANPHGVR